MMFGAWGNPDHDDSVGSSTAALDAGINFVDTADVYSAGESEEIVGKALKGRRDDVVLATKFHGPMGDDPNQRGNSRRWIIKEVEDSLRRLGPTGSTSTRCTGPTRTPTSTRRSARCPTWCTRARSATSARSTFPAERSSRRSGSPSGAGRERFRTEQPPYSILVRGIEAAVLPTASATAWACSLEPAGRRLAVRPLPQGRRPDRSRAATSPSRYDMSSPANQRKLDAVERARQAGREAGCR
jgi:aryl-alcohol dehydrogenase-like predicted oxidoreductase